jgi:uncharacterized protein
MEGVHMTEVKRVLMGEGLFSAELGDGHLIGTHCKSCGDYFFPRTFTCHNPQCVAKDVEDVPLSPAGKVSTYSAMSYPPPPPYVAGKDYQPIPVVAVELPEGIHIIGMMEDCDPADVSIGMEVKTVVTVLYTNDKGEELVGWKFKRV